MAATVKRRLVTVLLFPWRHQIFLVYLDYAGLAILHIVTCLLVFAWVLIDLVRILNGDLKPEDGEYAEQLLPKPLTQEAPAALDQRGLLA